MKKRYVLEGEVSELDHNLTKLFNWLENNYNDDIKDLVYLFNRYDFAFLTYKETLLRKDVHSSSIKVMNRVDDILNKFNLGSIKAINLPDLFVELKIKP